MCPIRIQSDVEQVRERQWRNIADALVSAMRSMHNAGNRAEYAGARSRLVEALTDAMAVGA